MHTPIIILTSLMALTINAQSHPMITPAPAPMARRQDNSVDEDADCLSSLGYVPTLLINSTLFAVNCLPN